MMLGTWFAVAYAVPRQVAETVCAKTSWRPKPTMFDTMVIAPMRTAARPIPPPACSLTVSCARPALVAVSCALVTGGWLTSPAWQADAWPGPPGQDQHRPGQHGPGLRWRGRPRAACAQHVEPVQRRRALDDPGEADLLAGGGERDDARASTAMRPERGRLAAAAAPSMAPRALAPQSPSMARSPRSSPASARAAPTGIPAVAAAPGGPATAISPPARDATLMARPGRRSNRLSRLAPPAIRPAFTAASTGLPPRTALAASPVAPMPPILTAPVVTSPWARAPR